MVFSEHNRMNTVGILPYIPYDRVTLNDTNDGSSSTLYTVASGYTLILTYVSYYVLFESDSDRYAYCAILDPTDTLLHDIFRCRSLKIGRNCASFPIWPYLEVKEGEKISLVSQSNTIVNVSLVGALTNNNL